MKSAGQLIQALLLTSALTSTSFAQSVQQSGTVTIGHPATWLADGVIGDTSSSIGPAPFNVGDMLCASAAGLAISYINFPNGCNGSLTYTPPGTGGSPTNFSVLFGQMFTPLTYGAVCNGNAGNAALDTAAIQNAINAAEASGTVQAGVGGAAGYVFMPAGYQCMVNATITISKPVDVDFRSFIGYTPTSGSAIQVSPSLPPAGQNQGYHLYFAGLRAINGNSSAPTGINTSGNTGIEILNMQFSTVYVGEVIAFTNKGFYCNATNNIYTGQVIEQNTFHIGQSAFNGQGIAFLSKSGTSSCGANMVFVDDSFSNWVNMQIDDATFTVASSSNTFMVTALDAAAPGGTNVISYSDFNYWYIGFLAGTFQLGAAASFNTVWVTNTLSTGVTFSDSGTANRLWSGGNDNKSQIASWISTGFPANSISLSALTNGPALSVVGSSAAGAHVDITGTANQVLRIDNAGSTLAFGQINLASAAAVTGTLASANGGTDNASYAIGDILYASGATALSRLADVATGNALISGGVGVAPSWGKIGLTTHVSGTLGVGNGGLGIASGTSGGVPCFTGSTTIASSGALTSNAIVVGGGAGVCPSASGATVTAGNVASTGGQISASGSGSAVSVITLRTDNGGNGSTVGQFSLFGQNSTPANISYGVFSVVANTVTAGAETGSFAFNTYQSGTLAQRINIGAGLSVGTTTDPGSGRILATSYIQTGTTTVGSLPTCNAGTEGARFYVTDQNTAVSYRGAVTGSGATRQAVLCSNSAWIQD